LWFLSGGGLMVENLTGLEMLLTEPRILFAAYPLKLAAGDGAPVRAVALIG
jgi:arylformamidase